MIVRGRSKRWLAAILAALATAGAGGGATLAQNDDRGPDVLVPRNTWEPRANPTGSWEPRDLSRPPRSAPVERVRPSWIGSDWFAAERSPAFPEEPWAYEVRPVNTGADGAPVMLVCVEGGVECVPRQVAARAFSEGARYWLLRGDAELTTLELDCARPTLRLINFDCGSAPGRASTPDALERAMLYWNRSVMWGRAFGAQASILSQRRLQAHLIDCPVSQASLSRISRDPEGPIADTISLRLRQSALKALGYYNGEVDGEYGARTREAVRQFQRELGYDETASLTPRQTAQLMCHAAQTARDASVQNVLGIMHATGLGVVQNTDLALEWLEMAARRGDPDASFNLAVIYGTGAVFGSYRLCAIVENPERADAYLRDAADAGHATAARLRNSARLRDAPDPRTRWTRISEGIEQEAATGRSGGATATEFLRIAARAVLEPTTAGCLDAPMPH